MGFTTSRQEMSNSYPYRDPPAADDPSAVRVVALLVFLAAAARTRVVALDLGLGAHVGLGGVLVVVPIVVVMRVVIVSMVVGVIVGVVVIAIRAVGVDSRGSRSLLAQEDLRAPGWAVDAEST